ncbi:hypothetical protein PMAYCL1PPCAC_27229 [Pristionchus mayeri]|uniref:Uncharacterized protein n=1 Tax=Pristionchus mayeri TaxID=1317129 RepID=A0AAN5D5Z6_9BILA|nr:hypothetical protein PMAYCL1PPCAC_27229 [Pristionchus mayeri]
MYTYDGGDGKDNSLVEDARQTGLSIGGRLIKITKGADQSISSGYVIGEGVTVDSSREESTVEAGTHLGERRGEEGGGEERGLLFHVRLLLLLRLAEELAVEGVRELAETRRHAVPSHTPSAAARRAQSIVQLGCGVAGGSRVVDDERGRRRLRCRCRRRHRRGREEEGGGGGRRGRIGHQGLKRVEERARRCHGCCCG